MIRFQINKRINKPLNVVFRVLADVDQFVQAHPLMEKAEKIRPQHYIIHECTPIGMWKFRFTYPAVINEWGYSSKVLEMVRVMAR